jgi:signal transduction histidine kinase
VQSQETQNIEGAGLGLYISRQIIKGHKGEIDAFSDGRGKGTRFLVSLPLNISIGKKNEENLEGVN